MQGRTKRQRLNLSETQNRKKRPREEIHEGLASPIVEHFTNAQILEQKYDAHCEDTAEANSTAKRRSPDRFNTLQIYGKLRINDRSSLIYLCRKTGIMIRDTDIARVQRRGYRNKYDSRHLLIVSLTL